MADVLLYGTTERSPALRHEVPVAIGDPFLYAEVGGSAYILCSDLERERLAQVRPDAELLDYLDLGFYELLGGGLSYDEITTELVSRAAARTGVREAIVDYDFALGAAERLRSDGIKLTVDDAAIRERRRAKSAHEMEGIIRAQHAADAAMATAAEVLRRARSQDGTLYLDGAVLRAEGVRSAMREACWELGAVLPNEVIVASAWQGYGHDPGTGPLPADLPITIDVWPRDEQSGCWADMTRTFVVGDPSGEALRLEGLVREAIERVRSEVRPGVTGRHLHALACEVFEQAGFATQRTGPREDPREGFQFSLGHGVGLEVHEDPSLGEPGYEPLVVGDVIAIEPGLWDERTGGMRYEDLVVVTDEGGRTLTDFPYGLTP